MYIYDTCAWTPNSVLSMSLLVYLGATFAFKRDSVTGARIPCTCYRSSLPCPRANHWITLLRAYSGLHRAYLANQQIIGIHCFGPTRAYLAPTLPTSKSLEYIASGLLGPTSGLPCQPPNHWNTLLRAYSGLPRAYLANQQIIGIHCFGPCLLYTSPSPRDRG